jgi:methylmalonyl-CoA mutase N-terminal domain/subunit
MEKEKSSQKEVEGKKFETASEIPIKEIYGQEDVRDIDYKSEIGDAGEYPFTRGTYRGMYRNKTWGKRLLSGFGSARDSMERLKYLASIGSEGVEVVEDNPGLLGIDCDHPMAKEEAGLIGIPVNSLHDLEQILEGFNLDKTTVSFETAGASGPTTACQFFALAEKQGIHLSALNGSVHVNPFDTFHTYGYGTTQPLDLLAKLAVDVVQFCTERKLRFVTFHGSARLARENGVNAWQELALGMSSQIAFIDKLLERGLSFDDFASRPVYTFAIGMDFLEEIAKYRAGRRMWAKIAKERYGAKNPRAMSLYLAVRASGRCLLAQQPLNNLIRTAYQLLAAALGGCNFIDPCLMDEPLSLPTENASWLGMCTQNILAHETGVSNVVDPLGGSYYIEYLTGELEKRAFEMIREIDKMGGLAEAVRKGWVNNLFEEEAIKFQKAIEKGEKKLVGLNMMVIPPEKELPIPIHQTTRASTEEEVRRTMEIKQRRNNKRVKELLKKLAQEDQRGTVNLVPTMIEACKEYATIGEIWGTLREARGLSYDPFGMIESPFKD